MGLGVAWMLGRSNESSVGGKNKETSPRSGSTSRAAYEASPHRTAGRSTIDQVLRGTIPKLTSDQIEAYLAVERNADNLLTAYRLSGNDPAYLREALERFPNDPHVLLSASQIEHDPAKRLELLTALRRNDPDNAMGGYLTSIALFDLGRADEAVGEMAGAMAGNPTDYTSEFWQNDEEAFLSAGYTPLEAKLSSMYGSTKVSLLQVRQASGHLTSLREGYEASGNTAGAESLRGLQRDLALQLRESGRSTIDLAVATVIEKASLKGLESDEAVTQRAAIQKRWDTERESALKVGGILERGAVSDTDMSLYADRVKAFGESPANDWLLKKYPGQ